jgi:transposase-like protein
MMTQKNKADIIKDYQNPTVTIRSICDKYAVSSKTVSKIIAEAGLKPRTKTKNLRTEYADIYADFLNGEATTELARKYKLSQKQINNAIRDWRGKNVVKQYCNGIKVERIAEDNGLSVSRVYQILKNRSVPLMQPKKAVRFSSAEPINIGTIICEYNNKDIPVSEICERYHVSSATLQKILIKNNIPFRETNKIPENKRNAIIKEMSENKEEIEEIARRYRLNVATIQKIMSDTEKENFPFRNETLASFVNDYSLSAKSLTQLCCKYKINREEALSAIAKNDAIIKRKKTIKNAVQKYKRGASADMIAAELGVSRATFYRIVNRKGRYND